MATYPLKSLMFIFGSSIGQSYVSSGLQAVLEIYLIRFLLVCSNRSSHLGTTIFNLYVATYQLCSITGGLAADKLLGNYMTQVLSNFANTFGAVLVAMATWQFALSPPSCCVRVNDTIDCHQVMKETVFSSLDFNFSTPLAIVLAAFGLLLFAVGYGQTNAIQSVFVANQFADQKSPHMTRSFSWYYFCLNVGALAGEAGMPILRQSLGFITAFFSVAGVSVISTILFLIGTRYYIKKKPHKRNEETEPLIVPSQMTMKQTLQQLWPILTVFLPLIIFWAIFFQQNSTWIQQGLDMDCYLGQLHIPPDLMASLEDVMVLLVIVVTEYLLYPHLAKTLRYNFPPLHKLAVGMACAAISFILAALLDIYLTVPAHDCRGTVSIVWQLPQYLLIAIAEVLVSVTGLEFAYSQAPTNMRNIVTGLWYLCQALGSLLNAGIAQIAMKRQWQFVMYSGLMWLLLATFLLLTKRYKYKKPESSGDTPSAMN
ncbi:solute carrier family 15 member 3-like isoform X2 [Dysidea avara]|uniref:solute carrier family 15 member 3-like isoform X2 n=1 Tax=Dysidea avara TaxID=196820 RepID=UPI00332CB918